MKAFLLSLTACSLLAVQARADIDLSFPASTSTDSNEIKTLTGATGFHESGDLSTYSLKLADRAVTFSYNIKMAPGGTPYHAGAGLSIPVVPLWWQSVNLRRATSVDFEMMSTAANKIQVIIGSKLYDPASVRDGAALTSADQKIGTTWSKYSIPTSAFAMPSWYTDCSGDCQTTFWANDGSNGATIEIGSAVDAIMFKIQTEGGWNGDGSELTSRNTGDFSIRNLSIIQDHGYVLIGVGCRGASFQLDNFDSNDPAVSREGNRWYAYSDASTDAATLNDSSTGTSSIVLPTGATSWAPMHGAAVVTANLEKNVAGSTFKYHPYAGWAGLGIDFGKPKGGNGVNYRPLKAVQFDMYLGPDVATMVPGAQWDLKKLYGIDFKMSNASTKNAPPYQAIVSYDQTTYSICVDLSTMMQPQWYNQATYGNSQGVPFVADSLSKMTWEMKIYDTADSSIHTSGPNTFAIAGVKLFGIDSAYAKAVASGDSAYVKAYIAAAGIVPSSAKQAFAVSYRNGLVLNGNLQAYATVDVLRMDGRLVRSVSVSEAASIRLGTGTYLVAIHGANGFRAASPLVVVR